MNHIPVFFRKAFSIPVLIFFSLLFDFSTLGINIYGQPKNNIESKTTGKKVLETVTDYDGNIYNIVNIGSQKWMQESLKSLHYADSSAIVGVMAYNNNETLVPTYGRLYTWYAAMNNSTTAGTQGACPNGWHLPTDAEWDTLINYLGGENVAGGHLKEAGTSHWMSPNTAADNSSRFTALPGGMYFEGGFHYLRYNVEFWSSSNSHDSYAWYRILYFDQPYIVRTDWFDKNTTRSVRCLCDEPTGLEGEGNTEPLPDNFSLEQNWPNPFNPVTIINYGVKQGGIVKICIYDMLGREVSVLVNEQKNAGYHSIEFNASSFTSGVYIYTLQVNGYSDSKKMILLR
jgi:uncharacterized protein (TIGR02145 family)